MIAQAALSTRRGRSDVYENLWDLELRVFSQFGEDGILDFLCDQLGLAKPKMLEIGAGDFTECNSRFMAENRHASVFAVDASKGLTANVARPPLSWRASLWARQTWVTPDNIVALFDEVHEVMDGIDVISMDLDGNDFWILQAMPLRGVSIVVVEYNPFFGGTRTISVPRDDGFDRRSAHETWLYFGASIQSYVQMMRESGFTFLGTNRAGNNAFFVSEVSTPLVTARLSIPSEDADFSKYTDWRVREMRGPDGELTLAGATQARSRLAGLQVINTMTSEVESL